jgi:hypothetical protein
MQLFKTPSLVKPILSPNRSPLLGGSIHRPSLNLQSLNPAAKLKTQFQKPINTVPLTPRVESLNGFDAAYFQTLFEYIAPSSSPMQAAPIGGMLKMRRAAHLRPKPTMGAKVVRMNMDSAPYMRPTHLSNDHKLPSRLPNW